MTRKSRREIERHIDALAGDDTGDDETIRVVSVGGDPTAGGEYTPEEYRERFDEEPPTGDDFGFNVTFTNTDDPSDP